MKTILKYLKPFGSSILLIVLLLLVQAMSELSLPEYMSNIVNIGIQQGGIEKTTPEVIRTDELEGMYPYMERWERELVESSFKRVSPNSKKDVDLYMDTYPLLASEDLHILEEYDKRLDKIFVDGIFSISELGETMTVDISDTIRKQGAIAYIKREYRTVGMDLESIQSAYILETGARMVAIALLSMLAAVGVGLIGAKVAAGLGRSLRSRLFSKVMYFSKAELDRFSASSLITRSTNDIQQVQNLMVFFLRIIFYAPILAIGGVFKVLSTDASMGWIIALAVGVIVVLVAILFGVVIPRFKKVQRLVDKINMITREALTGMLVIRAFNNQSYEETRFEGANQDLTKNSLFVGRIMAVMMPLMMLIMNLVTILIVWVGANRVDAGTIQIGDMMAFIQYTMQIIMAFLMISMVSIMLPRATVSANRVGEVLETESSIEEVDSPVEFDRDEIGTVEFKNVDFKYPDAEQKVLCNISFRAERGETLAFIGSTGSGKSTLINLIPRLYDASSGSVLVNGVGVRKVSQKSLRESIGYVPQKGILFSGDIESNIRYGAEDIDKEDMELVASIAQAGEFIEQKEGGYKSRISQGGANVSGGQKQRLSIARALAKRPPIFIFDDSFSALDFKTDFELRKSLKRELGESTLLIVAQRISTVINADKIVVLDKGRVVGIGRHKELIENCDVYRQIADSQLSKGGSRDEGR